MESHSVTGDRADVLAALADEIERRRRPGAILRVAIDGRAAAGKTTTAGELAAMLGARGLSIVSVSIDHFHRPGHKYRSINREWTPESYFDEGFDYELFRRLVLEPLAPEASGVIQPRHWNSATDEAFPVEHVTVAEGSIALIEGVFLGRPEFDECFDYRVWLDISTETMVARGRVRDAQMVGSEEEAERRYIRVQAPLYELYERRCSPAQKSDAVLENEDWEQPTLRLRG